MKNCFKCGREKPLTDFYKHKQMSDGHLNKCKSCTKSDVSKNYVANIDYYKKYDKERANLPCRVKAASEARCKWTRRNPIKRMASTIVGNAVRDGKLIKPDNCEACLQKPNRLHGHHDDYSLPLVVRWLCPGCHNKWHKENGPGLNAE